MKILFAVSNENITEAIKKEYQRNYKAQLMSKSVYYFNAIIKELQNNKSYDVIIINEELEPFNTINYDTIDKFLLEKLKMIREEAVNTEGNSIPIVFITTDRHILGDTFTSKLYEIGIYNALVGTDRNIENVCTLMFHPRSKKEARAYYRVNSDIDNTPKEDDVKEEEIKNIIAHYKKLGKAEEKYVESFDNIASQYSDAQLKVIIRFLPLNVKAVLEAQSPKYQSLTTFSNSTYTPPAMSSINRAETIKEKDVAVNLNNDRVLEQISSVKDNSNVIIPNSMNINKVRKISEDDVQQEKIIQNRRVYDEKIVDKENNDLEVENENILPGFDFEEVKEEVKEILVEEPEEVIEIVEEHEEIIEEPEPAIKKGRGRPRKNPVETITEGPKRGRGRPKKVQAVDVEAILDNKLLDFHEENAKAEETSEVALPGFDEVQDIVEENVVEAVDSILPGFDDEIMVEENNFEQEVQQNEAAEEIEVVEKMESIEPVETEPVFSKMSEKSSYRYENIEYLIPADKRIASFIGTSKSGVSFIVNSLGQMLSSFNINVAILDLTKNRNSYYIYTKNEQELRNKAEKSIYNLIEGNSQGIVVNKNLTVYTSLPTDSENFYEADKVLKTLLDNHSVVLIDCDYDTPIGYFDNSTDVFIVQNMDVLTIQPLTTFLKELKTKNVLNQEKLRFITNMETKVKGINAYDLLNGVSSYKAPSMEYMIDLFVPSAVQLFTIPFDIEAYNKYLTSIAQCEMSLTGYSKSILTSLRNIATCIYPLLATDKKSKKSSTYMPPSMDKYGTTTFNSDMERTLGQMKNKY